MPVSAAPPAFPGVFAMRPTRPLSGKSDLFRERLEVIIDPHHALVRLAGLVPWSCFDEAFGRFYRPIGRPAKPTRLMVGLHYLKHVHDLSDEEVVARWVENPYWQFFCGFEFFQHEVPLDASTMTRWRKRIGPAGLEEMLKASVGVALDTGVAKPSSLERVSVDTTVQPKAIAHPTDSRLYWKALQILVRQAKRHGVTLRQSHTRLAKAAMVRAGRHAHARQFRRMRRALKQLRTYLGRVFRDVGRKIAGNTALESKFARLLGLVERLMAQKPKDKDKLYALHAPEVVCIAKGKARTPYEFGAKVGIAVTNREGLVLAAKAFAGNPYDGHTLAATLDQATSVSGIPPARSLRHHASRAQTTIGHRGHHRPHEDRRKAGPELPPRPGWRRHQRATRRRRAQSAPRACRLGPLACLHLGRNRKGHRKGEYFCLRSPSRTVNDLAVVQRRPFTST